MGISHVGHSALHIKIERGSGDRRKEMGFRRRRWGTFFERHFTASLFYFYVVLFTTNSKSMDATKELKK